MASRSRIPQTLPEFDIYIRRVSPFINSISSGVITHGERLGLSPAENTAMRALHDQWYTGNPAAPGVYELHTDDNTKTKTTRNLVMNIVKAFTTLVNPLLTRMSTSTALTESDRAMLNIPARDTSATERGPIEDTPYTNITSLAGGKMKARTRITTDASRASMHPLADGVEMRYQVGGTQPVNAAACANSVISKKAIFTVNTGGDNGEKKFYCFCRYVNLVTPENSGPFGSLNTGSVQS